MGKICAFFGHRDAPTYGKLEDDLEKTVYNLIDQGVDEFWFGDKGTFDLLVRIVLKRVKESRRYIYPVYICAYNPINFSKNKVNWFEEWCEIEYPDEILRCPAKAAIVKRNQYMAEHADIVVCYIKHPSGGAYQAVQTAQKRNKPIINLANESDND